MSAVQLSFPTFHITVVVFVLIIVETLINIFVVVLVVAAIFAVAVLVEVVSIVVVIFLLNSNVGVLVIGSVVGRLAGLIMNKTSFILIEHCFCSWPFFRLQECINALEFLDFVILQWSLFALFP